MKVKLERKAGKRNVRNGGRDEELKIEKRVIKKERKRVKGEQMWDHEIERECKERAIIRIGSKILFELLHTLQDVS